MLIAGSIISVIFQCNFQCRYCPCFNKPYFQPDFPNKTTLVATSPTQEQPYFSFINSDFTPRVLWERCERGNQ
jgi:sulfatase maturation enzyme AslB (radical SAM superfamily)